jgi:hypothetical protein
LLIGLRAMRAARQALHVEKAGEGLVAVRLAPAAPSGAEDMAAAAETAATPTVTKGDR